MIKVQGHRGFSEVYPENTMIAFQKCYETGAFGIEMDVRVTADKEYVIIHDETVDRTTDGTGNVKFLQSSYILGLDAGSWFAPEYREIRVPTLDQVLTEFKGKNVKLVLHLYFTGTSIESDVKGAIDKIASKGMINQVQVFGEVDIINIAKSYNSNLYTLNSGLATINTYGDILANAVTNNHNAVSISSSTSDADLVAMITDIHNAGKDVHVSYLTSNYETRVQRFINYGAHYILGNNPKLMQEYVDSLEETETGKEYIAHPIKSFPYIKKPYGLLKPSIHAVKSYGLLKVDPYKLILEEKEVIETYNTNIIALGDSNTFGLYLAAEDSYPSQLNAMTPEDIQVLNKGISSNRTSHVIARLDDIRSSFIPGIRNIVVLQIGTNDSTDGRTPEAIYNDINNGIITPLKNHGFEVWSVTIPPRGDSTTVNEIVKGLNTLLRGNTTPNKVLEFYNRLVDSSGAYLPSMFGSDKKHLSKDACGVLAGMIVSELGITHSGVSATNLVTNGNFTNASGWSLGGGTLTATNNTGIIAMTETGNLKQTYTDVVAGEKFYAAIKVKPNFQLNRIDLTLRGSVSVNTGIQTFQLISAPTPNTEHLLSGIATTQATHTGKVEVPFRFYIDNGATGNIEVRYFIVINLTKTFGAGKEPTKAEMDTRLSKYPNSWFNGTAQI